jgi:hypothetical protein
MSRNEILRPSAKSTHPADLSKSAPGIDTTQPAGALPEPAYFQEQGGFLWESYSADQMAGLMAERDAAREERDLWRARVTEAHREREAAVSAHEAAQRAGFAFRDQLLEARTEVAALTLARDALKLASGLSDGTGNAIIDEALAAIEAELAASADAGRLAEEAKRAVSVMNDACMAVASGQKPCTNLSVLQRRRFEADRAINQLAALARPAPAVVNQSLTTAPVSAQGDERAAFEAWFQPSGHCLERKGEGYAYGVAANEWRIWQAARAQVAQGDEVDAARYREALEMIAAQTSGIVGSTSRADCMAAVAQAALAARAQQGASA